MMMLSTVRSLHSKLKLGFVRNRLLLSFLAILLLPSLTIGGFAYTTAHSKVDEQLHVRCSGLSIRLNAANRTNWKAGVASEKSL